MVTYMKNLKTMSRPVCNPIRTASQISGLARLRVWVCLGFRVQGSVFRGEGVLGFSSIFRVYRIVFVLQSFGHGFPGIR